MPPVPVPLKGLADMATITKKELIDRITDATGQKRVDVKRTIQRFLDEVAGELGRGNRLEFRDFGVFEIRERKRRIAQNPKTLERVEVPPRFVVKFKVGRHLQETVDAGAAGRPPADNGRVIVRPIGQKDSVPISG